MVDPIRAAAQPPAPPPRAFAATGLGAPAAGKRRHSPEELARTRQAAQEFEAMAIGQLLQPMFNTVNTSKGIGGGGKGEEAWKPMMTDEMAKMLAKGGGIGLADSVFKEMLRMQEGKERE
jgi:Rod binding domain-containing protein